MHLTEGAYENMLHYCYMNKMCSIIGDMFAYALLWVLHLFGHDDSGH